jgi:hypothetical protein
LPPTTNLLFWFQIFFIFITMHPTLEQEAAHQHTFPKRLRELASMSVELGRIVAKNPHSTPELLQELAINSDKVIRETVAKNEYTPIEVLVNLAPEFPEELLGNSMFVLSLQNNPHFVEKIPLTLLHNILMRQRVSTKTLHQVSAPFLEVAEKLCNSGKISKEQRLILEAIAQHPQTPGKVLQRLAEGTEARKLAVYIVEHPNTHAETFTELAEYPDERVHWLVAGSSHAPDYVLEKLAESPNALIRKAVARNPHTSAKVLLKLAQDDSQYPNDIYIPTEVALNPKTPSNILEALAKKSDGVTASVEHHRQLRKALSQHPNISESFIELLIENANTFDNLVQNRYISPLLLQRLAENENPKIRYLVALHPNTPVSLLEKLATDVRLSHWVADNPSTPPYILEMLAQCEDDSEAGIYHHLAINPNTPPTTLESLLKVGNYYVNRYLALNPSAPSTVLQQLADNPSSRHTLPYIAEHNNASETLLGLLSNSKDYLIRIAVSSNPVTPLYILKQLAADEDYRVRQAIARNYRTEKEELFKLAADKEYLVIVAVAENPKTPRLVLEKLAIHVNYLVREGVAKNSKAPDSILRELAQDKWQVAIAAIENPQMHLDTLQELAQCKSYLLRDYALRKLNASLCKGLSLPQAM